MRTTAFVRALTLGAIVAMAAPTVAHALEYDRAYSFGTQGGGVAVGIDRGTGNVYVAAPLVGSSAGAIERFDSAGDPLDPPTSGGGTYGGVSVDQASQRVHAFDPALFGGSPSIATFDASGAPVDPASFPVTANPPPALDFNQIAGDDAGDIYYPNAFADAVERFSPAGDLQGSIGAGGGLVDPSSVAVDSSRDVYVVDGVVNGGTTCEAGAPCDDVSGGRVQRFPAGGGAPVVVHDGNASSVAVDPVTDDILVGVGLGTSFEVVVYDESGSELTRFGSGLFGGAGFFPGFNNEIAVSATRRVYVTDPGSLQVEMFDVLPEATTGEALDVAAATATLTGTVDPNGGSLFGCRFEYGTTTDYGRSAPCASTPDAGLGDVDVSADVTGLSPGATYHFRLVVTNVAGSADGGDQAFATEVVPTPPTDPDPPPPPPTPPKPCAVDCQGKPAAGKASLPANVKVRSGKARIRLACKGQAGAVCKGRLKLVAKLKVREGKKAKRLAIGRGRYDVTAGSSRVLEIPLSRLARRALATGGKLRASVSGGGLTRRTIVLATAKSREADVDRSA